MTDFRTLAAAAAGFWLAALTPGIAMAATPPQVNSVCQPQEPVVFSCAIGTKLLSVCRVASGGTMARYRFGRPGVVPELTLPKKPAPLASFLEVTTYDSRMAGAHAREYRLKLRNRDTDYTITMAEAPTSGEWLGQLQVDNMKGEQVRTCQPKSEVADFQLLDSLLKK